MNHTALLPSLLLGAGVLFAASPAHADLNLATNLPMAHRFHGATLWASAADAGISKYLVVDNRSQRWRHDKGGVSFRAGALLRLPWALLKTDASTRLFLVVDMPRPGEVKLVVGKKNLHLANVPQGESTIEVPMPEAGALLTLAVHGHQWVRLKSFSVGATAFVGSRSLELGPRDRLTYLFDGKTRGQLAIESKGNPDCTLNVTTTDDEGFLSTTQVFVGARTIRMPAARTGTLRLDLEEERCAKNTLSRLNLALPATATVKKIGDTPPKHIVFWVMDSLRADRVRAINPKSRPDSPTLSALAKDGVLFRRAYVQGNESRVSYASFWTSTWPATHQMYRAKKKLTPKLPALDRFLQQAGYKTLGFTANGWIDPRHGYSAWTTFRNQIHAKDAMDAERVLRLALDALKMVNKEKWFLYIGTVDTHVPWRARKPWTDTFADSAYNGPYKTKITGIRVETLSRGKVKASDADKRHIVALYDSNVSYQDEQLAAFVKRLKGWGIWEETLLVITADHGDELWENGRIGHGGTLRETLVHVPLLLHYPRGLAPAVIDQAVDSIDVLPTILDLARLDGKGVQGKSLVGQGATGYASASFSSHMEARFAMAMGDYKGERTPTGALTLYNLARDAGERSDVSNREPLTAQRFHDLFSVFLLQNTTWRRERWGAPEELAPAFSSDW